MDGYAAKYKKALEKPIAPKTQRVTRKRHQLYVKEDQLNQKLTKSNSKLRHYLSNVQTRPKTVLNDLESEHIYNSQQ